MIKRTNLLLITVSLSAFLFFVGCGKIAHKHYSQKFGRVEGFKDDQFTSYITWKDMDQLKYPREEVSFKSGANTLQGFVYGATNSNGLVIISQGLGGTADSYFPLIMYFCDKGWRVFAYNNTGVGGSEGSDVGGLYQSMNDLAAALDFVKKTNAFDGLSIMLVGHSWGGFAVCAVLNYDYPVKAVVSFAGYNNGSELLDIVGKSSSKLYFLIKPKFRKIEMKRFGDVTKLTAVDGINKSGIPVMIVQSSDDNVITAEKTSIYAYRAKISNPNVVIVYKEGDEATGHERVFGSLKRKEYAKWVNENWKEYYEKDPENATLLQWAKEINFDKFLANELDADLMERINKLFNNAK